MGKRVEDVFEIGLQVVHTIRDTQSDKLEEAGRMIARAHREGHRFFVSGSGHSHTVADALCKNFWLDALPKSVRRS